MAQLHPQPLKGSDEPSSYQHYGSYDASHSYHDAQCYTNRCNDAS